MDSVLFPKIYCPFPSHINPHVQAAHEHTFAWAMDFRLIQKAAAIRRFLGSRFAWLSARAYPLADQEELELVNDWLSWMFLFDDSFDEGFFRKRAEQIPSILLEYTAILKSSNASVPSSPAAQALKNLCRRTFPRMSEPWRKRFTRHFVEYCDTYIWTVDNALQGRVPALEAYIEKRQQSGGMTLAIDLIELALREELPASFLASPEIEQLNCITNDVVCWSNDIASLAKERARGDVNNLIIVLQNTQHLELQEAIDRASEMVSCAVHQFEQGERALPLPASGLEEITRRYLAILKAWMRGNLDWSAETFRYGNVDQTACGAAPSYLEAIVAAPAQRSGPQ